MATTIAGLLDDATSGLLTLIQDRANLASVQVVPVYPGGAIAPDESIWIGPARTDADWGALGRRKREGKLHIDVVVVVARSGGLDQQAAAAARAWALATEVDQAVESDPTLGGAVRQGLVSDLKRDAGTPEGTTAWAVRIDMTVTATAAIINP